MKKSIHEIKKALRDEFKKKRKELAPETKAKRDAAIYRYTVALSGFRFAEHILMYAPTADEIDVMPIAEEALRRGKKVYFPRCNKETRTMIYRQVSDLSELSADAFGILAPPESAAAYDIHAKGTAMCLIPGLVYDRFGYRTGYGGGYYDRFLPLFKGIKAGVIYSDFIIDSVPRGHFDIKVDIMLTERNVRIPLEG